MIGTTIEWYDFFIFGTASALVFNKLFFSSLDPVAGMLAAFSTFAAGLFARPLGALFFGHFGDRIGRKRMLVLSLLLMGIPTTIIGLLPTYEQVGLSAVVALVFLRICQGVALGGEWGGAVLMAVEHAPKGRRGLFGSLPQAGCPLALILSSAVFAWVNSLPGDAFLSWGWRLPFLASALLIVVGVFVRRRVGESPDFARVEQAGETVRVPVAEIGRRHLTTVLLGVGAKLGEITMFWLMAVFALSYATGTLGLPRGDILRWITVGAVVMLVLMPLCGSLADRVGKRALFAAGNVALLICAVPLFMVIGGGDAILVGLSIAFSLGVLYPVMYAPEASLFSMLFPAKVRYTGLSLSANVGGAIGGGVAPLAATWLLSATGSIAAVGAYLAVAAAVSLACTWAMRPVEEA
ncbi:MHS family MFS transporter [Methylobacterium sp. J-030]|uniref:MFS transporter n=1 Tax=Methylobacterium sp. J-030 TaxID=2836627 RepID=UPI001FB8DB51|nr:MFS transporter [Methylobacterium sp. J-030]MCJ2071345.1 MHS family MFS transporter [Methylobacterium sp. J-030]